MKEQTEYQEHIAVSVIIPVYNAAAYLPQCLDSICNQTLQNIEIICVDDGSTDNSLEILEIYAEKDSRFQLLQQKNTGAGTARNTGLNFARGKYLSFLDADDFFELDMLEKAYLQCEKGGVDFCVFRADQYDQKNNIYVKIPWTIKRRYLPVQCPFTAEEIYSYIFQIFNGWAWDKLYRKEFIEKNNLKFQELRTTNDAFFVFMANVLAEKITIGQEVLAHHRVNVKTSLSVTREKSWECCLQAVFAIREELIRRNLYEKVEQSFVNWTIHFLLWNIYTLDKKTKAYLMDAIQQKCENILQIEKYTAEYFYDSKEYYEFLKICRLGKNAALKESNVRKTIKYFQENGWKSVLERFLDECRKKV